MNRTPTMTVISSLTSQCASGARILSLPAADVARFIDEMYANRGWDRKLDLRGDLDAKIRRGGMKFLGRKIRVIG